MRNRIDKRVSALQTYTSSEAARAEDHLLEWEEARRELESSKRTIFDLTRMIKRVKRQQMRLVDAIIDS